MEKYIQQSFKPVDFYSQLKSQNLIHDETPHLLEYLKQQAKKSSIPTAYAGYDPTASSLQVGNLVPTLVLRRAQLSGVRPIALLGGGTGLIGDPSGKKSERSLLEKEELIENLENVKKQLSELVDTSPGKYSLKFLNNYDWIKDFSYIDFLRDIGKHITLNYMLAKDSIKSRMDSGISYAEFGYMLIQAYDFYYLYKTENCTIQLGGSDQWGNMTAGIEIIRRKTQGEAHALSTPLLTDASGNKLGKTEEGSIFIDPKQTSPYSFYQYWLNQADSSVFTILSSLTILSEAYLKELEKSMAEKPEEREAQKTLARELTSMIHGKESTAAVESVSKVLFSRKPESLNLVDKKTLSLLKAEVPSSCFSNATDRSLAEVLSETKLCNSKGDARRQISAGAISINYVKVSDPTLLLSKESFQGKAFLLLGRGKKQLHLLLKE